MFADDVDSSTSGTTGVCLFEFLAAEQTKRRHIICSLVHSENNYLASLDRLVGEYKLEQILASHLQFRGALTEAVQSWDQVRGRTAGIVRD